MYIYVIKMSEVQLSMKCHDIYIYLFIKKDINININQQYLYSAPSGSLLRGGFINKI